MLYSISIPLTGINLKGFLNCSDLIDLQYIPTLPEVLRETPAIALIVASCCITILITFIFIEEAIRIKKIWSLQIYCYTIAALAVFPIASLCFLLTMLMPRAYDVNTTTATLYQPLSMVLFFKLIVSYIGGEDRLRAAIDGKKIPLTGAPFYFLCHFCPTTYMNRNIYYFMKASIYQLFLAPCCLYFVMGICSKTGVYTTGQFSFENAHMYIISLGAVSFCIGVYALVILYKMAQVYLPGYNIRGKYYALQSFFVVTRIHVLIFDTLGNNHFLPCYPPISAFTFGLYIRSSLLLLQAFILSLIARYLFLRNAPSGHLESCETISDPVVNT